VSAANSLVGSTSGDEVGSWAEPLSNGHYVVVSTCWDNGAAEDTGAVTWGSGITGVVGSITASNSVLGTTTAGGGSMVVAYDYVNNQLVVGRPADKIVTLFRPFTSIFLPVVLKEGA
jgi:hypothetical protein